MSKIAGYNILIALFMFGFLSCDLGMNGSIDNPNELNRNLTVSKSYTEISVTPSDHTDSSGNSFNKYILLSGTSSSEAYKAAYSVVRDVDNDGYSDIVISQFGPMTWNGSTNPGQVIILKGTGDLGQWDKSVVLPTSERITWPQELTVADIDGDSDLDIFVPAGFLVNKNSGAIWWYEQKEDFSWEKHEIVTGSSAFYHYCAFEDIDGDGIKDIIAGAETTNGAIIEFYKGNDSVDRFDKNPVILNNQGGGSFTRLHDVDHDGLKDIICGQFFVENSSGESETFAWFKNPGNTTSEWTKYVIDNSNGPGFQMEYVENLFGYGVSAYIGTNHTNTLSNGSDPDSGVFLMTPNSDVTLPWDIQLISTGIQSRKTWFFAKQFAPGIFRYGDVNKDGRIDITVSGDGDSRVFWLMQKPDNTFETITLAGSKGEGGGINPKARFGQCGGMNVVDLDMDGKMEILVNSWEGNTVNIFEWNN